MASELALRSDSGVVLRPRYPDNRRAQRETFTFRDAEIIFRNFSGKPTQFKPEGGVRGFSILLDEDLGKDLMDRGLNVTALRRKEEDDDQMYHLPVAVSYNIRPPRVYMVSGNPPVMPLRKTLLPEDSVHMLDNLDLAEAHMVIAISNYEVRGQKGKKAYLQSFFGHILLDELEQEYATVEDMIDTDLAEHREDDDVIEGEIVDD